MKAFSQTTCEALNHYVYTLTDPRTNLPFYVGEGVNNRVFNHEVEADENPEVEKAKLETIRSIKEAGYEVIKKIIHSGMEDKVAFECECSLIDGYTEAGIKLTNIAGGHHSTCMTVDEAEARYGAEVLYTDEYPDYKFVMLKVRNVNDEHEEWRNGWSWFGKHHDATKDGKLAKADYVCIRFGKVVRKVFKVHEGDWKVYYDENTKCNRYDFIGTDEIDDIVLKNKLIYKNAENEVKASKKGADRAPYQYYNI